MPGTQGVEVTIAPGCDASEGMASGRKALAMLHPELRLMFGASRASDAQDAQDAKENFC